MSALKRLRDKLEAAATQSVGSDGGHGREFIPDSDLEAIMICDAISQALQEVPKFEPYIIKDYASHIHRKARRVFAVLLLIKAEGSIVNFLDYDFVDAKLPFDFVGDHKPCLEAAEERLFREQQWRFLAPKFIDSESSTCRYFTEQTVLPFIAEESMGSGYSTGTSGQISKVWIHPSHQNLCSYGASSGCPFARKKADSIEFCTNSKKHKAFEAESRSLGMVRRLRHRSIVHLLAAFIHGSTYNFIFPLADMDLETFLHLESRHPAFDSNTSIYLAMAGIASALTSIHDYEFKDQDMAMSYVGFHHDLKPENILVKGNNFLITDFGLARFSDKRSPARSRWQGGTETYGPPEIDPEFRNKGDVDSCAVDLWSFGCIMIEVVAFILEGPNGLENFRLKKGTWRGRLPDDCFHRGKRLKKGVNDKIDEFREHHTRNIAAMHNLDLALLLLDPEPSERRHVDLVTEVTRNASASMFCTILERTDRARDLPLHLAAGAGNIGKIQELIRGGIDTFASDQNSRTALHWAALCNQGGVLKHMLEYTDIHKRHDLIAERDDQDRTALSVAAQHADYAAVKNITDAMTSRENLTRLVTQCDAFGMSPLHLACEAGNCETAKLLLNTIDSEQERLKLKMMKDFNGMTALHYAAQKPELETIELLLYEGKRMVRVQTKEIITMANNSDDEGLTPLSHAEKSGCTHVAALLAEVTRLNGGIDSE